MNDRLASVNELKANTARAYGKNCQGCLNHQAAIMLSFQTKESGSPIKDVFLDQGTADSLYEQLGAWINANRFLNGKPE